MVDFERDLLYTQLKEVYCPILNRLIMFATFIAVLMAIYGYISAWHDVIPDTPAALAVAILGTVFLLILPLMRIVGLAPLQRAEYYLTPRVVELYLKDPFIRLRSFILIAFPLICYGAAIDLLVPNGIENNILVPVMIILLGIAIDCLHQYVRRTLKYMDATFVSSQFGKAAIRGIEEDQDLAVCEWIDCLSEVGIRAVQRTSTSLCIFASNEIQQIVRSFLKAAKSIAHQEQHQTLPGASNIDMAIYTLLFALQRLEVINSKAVEQRIEPVCSNGVTAVGKIIIDASHYDLSLAVYPLPFLGRFSLSAQRQGLVEVGTKAVCTLLEVAKAIVTENDLTYLELKTPFFLLITQLQEITKEMFKQDKSINMNLLIQPFTSLKEMFQQGKVANHQDAPAILSRIDGAINEYLTLEAVMKTMPVIAPNQV